MTARTPKFLEVIFFESFGKYSAGQVVSLKAGDARPYLTGARTGGKPIAKLATKANIAKFESQKGQLESIDATKLEAAQDLARQVSGQILVVNANTNDPNKIHKSLGKKDIIAAAREVGIELTGSQILDDNFPIRTPGIHAIRLRLHPQVAISATIEVALPASLQHSADERRAADAAEVASALQSKILLVIAQGRWILERGCSVPLENSVTVDDVSAAATNLVRNLNTSGGLEKNWLITPQDIALSSPISSTGLHNVSIELTSYVSCDMYVAVFPSVDLARRECRYMQDAGGWKRSIAAALDLSKGPGA